MDDVIQKQYIILKHYYFYYVWVFSYYLQGKKLFIDTYICLTCASFWSRPGNHKLTTGTFPWGFFSLFLLWFCECFLNSLLVYIHTVKWLSIPKVRPFPNLHPPPSPSLPLPFPSPPKKIDCFKSRHWDLHHIPQPFPSICIRNSNCDWSISQSLSVLFYQPQYVLHIYSTNTL